MSRSLNDIVGQMRQSLAVSDPDLDTSVGTTTRKIVDAVAESIAESYLDQHMLAYTYDIDSKVEGDLDTFTQSIGGISRLAAKRATGTVTFIRAGALTATVVIPTNTQINSNTDPVVAVQTMSGAVIQPNQTSVTVAVQAVVAGPEGNLAANTLTLMTETIEGVASVVNMNPMTGGMGQETDSELRARWKKTAFRSMAGTESMYLGTALDDANVTAAVVLGASKRRQEQVQVISGEATSVADDIAYTFPTGVYVGADLANNVILLKDIDYSWDTTVNPPKIVFNPGVSTYDTGKKDGSGNPIRAALEGALLDLEFEYTPKASRNDPEGTRFGTSTMSKVDVYVAGQRPKSATQSVVFRSTATFSSDPTASMATAKFVRLDGSRPTAGNIFIPLAFGPIIAVPQSLTIGGATYGLVGGPTAGITHPSAYRVVHDDTPNGYTATSRFGLEFNTASLPANNTVFTMGANGSYLFDEVPRSVQAQVDRWRLVGVDAKVHAARQIALRFSLALMYERNASKAVVDEAIDVAVSTYLGRVGLGGVVQVSDIENVVHNVSGVDNVRVLAAADYPGWTIGTTNTFNLGIQRVVGGSVVETYVTIPGRLKDIVFGDAEAPVLESIVKVAKAQNTFQA